MRRIDDEDRRKKSKPREDVSVVPVRVKWKEDAKSPTAINIAGLVAQLVDSVKKKNCGVVHTILPLNISNFNLIFLYICALKKLKLRNIY